MREAQENTLKFKTNTNWYIRLIFGVILILLTQTLLSIFIHKITKQKFKQELLQELKTDVAQICRFDYSKNDENAYIEFFKSNCSSEKRSTKPEGAQNDARTWNVDYNRIPVRALAEFCKKTKNICSHPVRKRRQVVGSGYGYGNSPGLQDPRGLRELRGLPGPKGEPGKAGKAGLPGEPGPRGQKGDPGGPQGDRGFPGPKGDKGNQGERGSPGEEGAPGDDGDDGDEGPQGPQGPQGSQGISGQMGPQGPSGQKGNKGEMGYPSSIPGPKGDRGWYGPPGQRGGKGEIGFPSRIPGPKGDRGLSGQKGDKGGRGEKGYRGEDGNAGKDGEEGPEGPQGPKGENGQQGEQGLTGPTGPSGAMGPQGPPGQCPICTKKLTRCDFTTKITKYGHQEYSELPQRRCECQFRLTGDKVTYGYSKDLYSSWMVDSSPTDSDDEKFWVTNPTNCSALIEYVDAAAFASDMPTKVYDLVTDFDGNAHVVYGGRFIYKAASKPRIVAYYLSNQTSRALAIPGITSENIKPLYESRTNYFDFSVDENGLWVIFAVPKSTNTGVMKVDANTHTIQYMLNISVDHSTFMEMFVASGILYGAEGGTNGEITISLGLDLYKKELVNVQINDFGSQGITMFSFNHKETQLLILDRDKKRISYQASCGEKESMSTTTTATKTATEENIARPATTTSATTASNTETTPSSGILGLFSG